MRLLLLLLLLRLVVVWVSCSTSRVAHGDPVLPWHTRVHAPYTQQLARVITHEGSTVESTKREY